MSSIAEIDNNDLLSWFLDNDPAILDESFPREKLVANVFTESIEEIWAETNSMENSVEGFQNQITKSQEEIERLNGRYFPTDDDKKKIQRQELLIKACSRLEKSQINQGGQNNS